MIFLHDGHDEFEMNIQAELERGFGGVNDGRGQGLARGNDLRDCGLVRSRGAGYGCGCRGGFEDVCFHEYNSLWFELRSQRGTEGCRVQHIMASNRRWRCPFRYRGSRRRSAVAQLSTLGHERFWILLCWFGWRRFGQFDLDEQDFGRSFGFSSRWFTLRASAEPPDWRV